VPIEYWPFCIGANKTSDYSLVAGPDFLIAGGRTDFFRTKAFRLTAISRDLEWASVDPDSTGIHYVAAYRSEVAELGGRPQQDAAGRALYNAIGFVVREPQPGQAAAERVFEECQAEMQGKLDEALALDGPIGPPLSLSARKVDFDNILTGVPSESEIEL